MQAAAGCKEQRGEEEEEEKGHRRRTRTNISGPNQFAPAFAGDTLTCFAQVLLFFFHMFFA